MWQTEAMRFQPYMYSTTAGHLAAAADAVLMKATSGRPNGTLLKPRRSPAEFEA